MNRVGILLVAVLGSLLVSLAAADDWRDAARRAGNPIKDDALYYNPHIAVEKGRTAQAGASIVSSSFAANDEGWTAWKPSGWQGPVTFTSGMVSVSSSGSDNVYFSSPDSWRGDRSAAYNGKLTFRTGTTSSSGGKVTDGTVFDVALVAQCGYALTLSGVLSNTQTQDYSIDLHEDAQWIDSRTGKKPNMFDFLGVLSNLEAVRIRGSLNTGDETSALYQASLLTGRQWHPCCTLDDTVDICTKPGAPYYNPDTLKFYCEGHLAQPVRVKTVFPRFARRTGGSTITVYGENFGLEGSTPIVRVGGVMCQRTWYATPDTPTSGNKGPDQESMIYCLTPENEGFDRGVTVEAASGSVDSPYQVRQSADRTAWEVREASATSCLSDDSHGFEFGGHDFQWAAAVKNKATVGTHPVGVDRNTGDVYLVVSASDSSALDTEVGGAHIRASDNNPYQCAANAKCELLYKFSRDGSPMWVALMISAANAAEDLDVTSLVVDESDSPPSVYVAGTYKPQGTSLAGLKLYPGSGKGNTVPSFSSGDSAVTNIASQSLAATGTAGAIGFVARYDADGVVHWARPIICDSDTTGVTGVRMAAYRPSTSRIINHHTQGDEPSQAYILGKQKDNGGIYVTGLGSLANTKTIYYGYEPPVYKGNANPSAVQSAAAGGTIFVPFLMKMDKDGAVIWSRVVGRASGALGVAAATKVVLNDVAAGDDKVFVAAVVKDSDLHVDSCQFQSLIEGQGATLSENAVCTINAANTRTLESTATFGGVVIIAYDASGVYQWSQKQTAHKDDVMTVSLGWARSFRGGRPLKGNVQHWASHETLQGRLQPSMGRVNDVGSESRDESISDGTWLYSATTIGKAAGATITVAGAKFPEVSPSTVTAAAPANGKVVLVAKYKASSGETQWAEPLTYINADGSNEYAVSVSDIAVDDQTGAVYVAGQAKTILAGGQNAAVLHCNTANKDAANECGRDLFGIHASGDLNRLGCPADPRKLIRSHMCGDGSTNRAVCTKGLYFKEFGLPFCRFVTQGSKNTAFVAKINEGYRDSYRRTKSKTFSPDGTLVEWFKYLGQPASERFGSTLAETSITLETLSGRIAIHDSDVYVSGQALGVAPTPTAVSDGSANVNVYPLTLRFEGVHAVNSTILDGISFGSSAVSAGFLSKLVD